MRISSVYSIVLLLLVLVACKRSTPDYYTTTHGLKYKYHELNDSEETPKKGDYLEVFMDWKTTDDSVFYSSSMTSQTGKEIIKLGKSKHLGGIEEGFSQLKLGDSVSFYFDPRRFYRDYLMLETLPQFLEGEQEMVITLRLLNILSAQEYESQLQKKNASLELKELKSIQEQVNSWKTKHDTVYEINGSYLVMNEMKETPPLKYGEIVTIHYVASFLDGKEFYNTYKNGEPDEFQIGKEDQMIEGFNDAVVRLKHGESATVLIPSYKGFGSKGAVGGIVPPYTPVIYQIEILE